jgi:hypothetical protein
MRILAFIFLLFVSHLSSWLEGTYSENYHGFGGGVWEFKKDGTFAYHEINCEGGREGIGNYTMDNDSIHFIFKNGTGYNLRPESRIKAEKSEPCENYQLNMNLKDLASEEDLVFAPVLVKDSAGNVLGNILTDIDGNARITLEKYAGKITVAVSYIGYAGAAITLETPGCYMLKGKLVNIQGPSIVSEGEKWDYRILKREKNKITVQTSYAENGPEGIYRHNVQFDLVRARR